MAGNHNTFIAVPNDVTDPVELHRFLARLIEKLDEAFGARADNPFVTVDSLKASNQELTSIIGTNIEASKTSSSPETSNLIETLQSSVGILENQVNPLEQNVAQLQLNLNQPIIADSTEPALTIGATYSQTQVQALADQVQGLQTTINDIIDRLRLSKIIRSA